MLKYHLPLITIVICLFAVSCAEPKGSSGNNFYTAADFPSVKKYDTHIHLEKENTVLVQQAIKDNFRLLSINGTWGPVPVEEQQKFALHAIKAHPEQVSFASSFNINNWNDPEWQKTTLDYLKQSFDSGAVAVKVWKNIGMELRDKDGKFVMIDDPRFDPIFDYIEKNQRTLLSHQGEPKNCWLPLDQMTNAGDKEYFSNHPQYHMFLHPEYPSYDDQINARDRMVAKHPGLKIVSVHLASLEWNVDEIAKRLDKFPNMAVDMAARIEHLQNTASTDWKKIYDFFIKYQDRILYATDLVESAENTESTLADYIHNRWLSDWKFLATDESLTNSNKANFKGLQLPKEVVDKIFAKNAERWIPGITKQQ